MYCIYDNKNSIIAFHDEYEIVETYLNHLYKSHPNEDLSFLKIGKIKKKKIKKIEDLDSLYLVRYQDTYIQSGYLEYTEILSCNQLHDERLCKDVLLRILECNPITDKERKYLEKSVKIIDRFLTESKEFTPSLDELKRYESDFAPYITNKKYF